MDQESEQKQQTSSPEVKIQVKIDDFSGRKNVEEGKTSEDNKISGEFESTHSTASDYFTRAGGFGARDDISSFLPVASDFTDFEASLRDARNYEDPEVEICRPGLGWTDVKKHNVRWKRE